MVSIFLLLRFSQIINILGFAGSMASILVILLQINFAVVEHSIYRQ